MSRVVTIEEPPPSPQLPQTRCREKPGASGSVSANRPYDFLYGKRCPGPPSWVSGILGQVGCGTWGAVNGS
uniref:Uncharacterized protein n=1 Tax=Canis lupus dingo TaxID=286419 RepID=A0A8C0JFG8_CANLU